MDIVTQGLFGAVVAQASVRARLGRRALIVGAAGGLAPDLDSLATLVDPFLEWSFHRGPTHSLLVGLIAGPVLALLLVAALRLGARLGRRPPPPLSDRRAIVIGFSLAFITHPLLDLFTSYGTRLLYPLSTTRFTIDAFPAVDLLFSATLVALLVADGFTKLPAPRIERRARWALTALALYAGFATGAGVLHTRAARAALEEKGVELRQLHAYPVLLQPWTRRVVALDEEGNAYIGYAGILPRAPRHYERLESASGPVLDAALDTDTARLLTEFSRGATLWTLTERSDGWLLRGEDLRYGVPGLARSLWGYEQALGAEGHPVGAPRHVREHIDPREVKWQDILKEGRGNED